MGWQWFHRLGSPKWFYEKTDRWMPWLIGFSCILLVAGLVWGLGFTPADRLQGHSYRIMYIHVPASIVAMAGYVLMAVCGGIGLIWRMKLAFATMRSAAPIGAVLTFLSLVTGSIWGKPTWGTWWEWDARITLVLLLFFLYLGIIALQSAYRDRDAADDVSAILALVGVANIPLIYWSVDWWYSLHQEASIKFTEASTIAPSMIYPLIFMIGVFYLIYATFLLAYTRTEVLRRERKTRWVEELVMKSQGDL